MPRNLEFRRPYGKLGLKDEIVPPFHMRKLYETCPSSNKKDFSNFHLVHTMILLFKMGTGI
ncbi:BEM_collapsed_G0045650.mRNA.1.CDS.1 [Saccharomyces cerevisiae]|nr:BEM_collapsed_G0045650.mRNA.1.CDS.1 [Saccharomyces cerevisiae]